MRSWLGKTQYMQTTYGDFFKVNAIKNCDHVEFYSNTM